MSARVLIVDDDPLVVTVVNHVVARLGYETASATSGHEAIRLLEEQPVDLLICDLSLPDISGLNIGRYAHARDIAVLLISGHLLTPEELEQGGLPEAALLQKPFGIQELQTSISALLRDTWRPSPDQ